MFLHGLDVEESKIFLNLADIAMKIDGDISDEEVEVFDTYANECFLPNFKPYESDIDVLLNKLTSINVIKKRVIVTELIGIWGADNLWDDNEISMMYYVGDKLGFSKIEVDVFKNWSLKMKNTIEEGYAILEGVV